MNASTSDRYKWIALSNTTLAMLLATVDGSITISGMAATRASVKILGRDVMRVRQSL